MTGFRERRRLTHAVTAAVGGVDVRITKQSTLRTAARKCDCSPRSIEAAHEFGKRLGCMPREVERIINEVCP